MVEDHRINLVFGIAKVPRMPIRICDPAVEHHDLCGQGRFILREIFREGRRRRFPHRAKLQRNIREGFVIHPHYGPRWNWQAEHHREAPCDELVGHPIRRVVGVHFYDSLDLA